MRTAEQIAEGYRVFRGRCKEMCEELVKQDPELEMVRGHIMVPSWPSDPMQPHWWCKRPDGAIVDPTWEQFPFQNPPARIYYVEFDGTVECADCGKVGRENEFTFESRYAFCSHRCHGRFVGLF